MKTLSSEPKVVALANALRVNANDAVGAIREFCQRKVAEILRRGGPVSSIEDLQALVCESLNLKVREISSDNQLDAVAKEYLDQGEIVFAYLRKDLDPDTYGVLIRLEKFTAKGFAWVAIVDCRGRKAQRRFFTL